MANYARKLGDDITLSITVGTAVFSGVYNEFIIYRAALTEANREAARDYLNTKWSVY